MVVSFHAFLFSVFDQVARYFALCPLCPYRKDASSPVRTFRPKDKYLILQGTESQLSVLVTDFIVPLLNLLISECLNEGLRISHLQQHSLTDSTIALLDYAYEYGRTASPLSLPCSQEPTTLPSAEQDESTQHLHTLFKISFNIFFPSTT
jgi:hypothetical protein